MRENHPLPYYIDTKNQDNAYATALGDFLK